VARPLQGTVATFNETEHDGSLLLDDGTMLTFPAAAFAASGLRLLRLGQRVRFERSETGEVILVTIITLP
jgi:2-phospho-L-lactate/phosphoenolpyruvate guanylyltransferase